MADKNGMVHADQNLTDLLDQAKCAFTNGRFGESLQLASRIKAARIPVKGVDQVRAQSFHAMGSLAAAHEALKEELRLFPDNQEARQLLLQITQQRVAPLPSASECDRLIWQVRDYTMVGPARLKSLYDLTKRICLEDVPGQFVECGVAAGGSSALIAYVIKRYSRRLRQLYCFDSFEGMPDPTADDQSGTLSANATGWGAGTCQASEQSLHEICNILGVSPLVRPVKGLFKDSLPRWRDTIGEIAFLHMDGDWYESTRDILESLYDRVSPGCPIQVDDYGHWSGCRKALHEFESRRSLSFDLQRIDETGVWFEKPDQVTPLRSGQNQRRLNLGCGAHYHPAWVNLDFTSSSREVIAHDLTQGIPFASESFDVVYHSHLLEHFTKDYAPRFLRECHRVLTPGGIIRVAVPDLEAIARLYLSLLDGALDGDPEAQQRYDWILIELFDQMVRNHSGGEMLAYWRQNPMPAETFVLERMGSEVKNAVRALRASKNEDTSNAFTHLDLEGIARFRLSGEVHQWMYDRYSLGKLLTESGFESVKVCRANESSIPDFGSYLLDIERDGSIRKPDSLFMEGLKSTS
ncbi:TylF/MycF/NovP-related O-methyltransferase [Allochromatium vinosum]|uniref:TylF/MycF/NovP-related O-methyltransferase n=1 Tax=Allochromatium vinosum TaxID=1049 RepID=UPI001906DF9C|nr:TylF/MycF/NovP-related O-methyltransferase [Allochromatium vinosum]MBK1656075.1 hypothetical protein [Allochromatium vinosum]